MRVFYDSTQLVHWEGTITGIPRVMNELGKRFHDDSFIETVFVSWVKAKHSLIHVDYVQSIEHRGAGIRYLHDGENDEIVAEQSRKTFSSMNVVGENVAQKTLIQKVAKKGVSGIKRVHPRVGNKVERVLQERRAADYKIAEPQAGDVVFIGWGEWWDDGFIYYLQQQAKKGVKIVQIIHDLLPLSDPQFSGHSTVSLGRYCEAILPICELVLCVSEYTKNDTITWLKSKKLHVPEVVFFRLGDDFSSKKATKPAFTAAQAKHIRPDEFVLSVGTLEARKNFTQFYYAYKLAKSRGIDLPTLVHVGKRGWKTENIYDIVSDDPQVADKIFLMGGVSDEELTWYYANCKYLAHPSFCEGWGLQIAESAMNGKPVIASSTSSMPEVIGDRAMYVNPYSSDELLTALQQMNSQKVYDAQKKKVASYKPTSWDTSYTQIKDYMKSMLTEKEK